MKKKVLITVIVTLTICSLFGCSSKTETAPDTQAKKTQVVEEKEETIQTETKNVIEKIHENIEEAVIDDDKYITHYDELQLQMGDSEFFKLPIRISELYDKGFYIIDEETEEPLNLDEEHNRSYGYGYIIYTDKDGNETNRIGCITYNLAEEGTKRKDSYIISVDTKYFVVNAETNFIEEAYENDVTLINDIKVGISTKEDVAKAFGYPMRYDEAYNKVELTEEEFQEANYFRYNLGDRKIAKRFSGEITIVFDENGIIENVDIQGECKSK